MVKLVCERCAGIWYLNNRDIEKESYCPFCRGKIFEYEDDIENIDNLDKAVYMIIKTMGKQIINEPKKLVACLYDTVPDLKKEINVLNNAYNSKYASMLYKSMDSGRDEIEKTMVDIRTCLVSV